MRFNYNYIQNIYLEFQNNIIELNLKKKLNK